MFDQLADAQESGTTKKKSVVLTVSVIFHGVLIVFAIILPMLFPETLGGVGSQLTMLVAPPPPPPAAPPAPGGDGSGQASQHHSGHRFHGPGGNTPGHPHGGG